MAEIKLVVDQLKLTYEGVMDVTGLFKTIDAWFYEKGYDKYEAENTEQDLPSGKTIEIVLKPWKKTTDYFENRMKIRMKFSNIKDIEIEKDKEKIRVQTGKVMMIFDAYLRSDYEDKWEGSVLKQFIRTLYDKFIYKNQFAYFQRWVVNDTFDIHSRIQSFLNTYKYNRRVP